MQEQVKYTMFTYQSGLENWNRFRHSLEEKKIVLIVYVDDIILTGDDVIEIKNLKERLASEFEIKDVGPLKYFLSMEIAQSNKRIIASQRKYVLYLLKK